MLSGLCKYREQGMGHFSVTGWQHFNHYLVQSLHLDSEEEAQRKVCADIHVLNNELAGALTRGYIPIK